ncbi:MAG: hypothetical protein UT32_C0034G0002 [Parcubacteria group bacterium GW2011_GWC2_39_14]|nr:MAG: hypothetical protein UT32_C0034G0002 [Parcubacteria group bacterium GW2011_GWC2_39_14]
MKIYLDDNHQGDRPTPTGWMAAHNFQEFKDLLRDAEERKETIEAISFDNDLGPNEPEGKHIMKWLAETWPELLVGETEVTVHSANPVASKDMRDYLEQCRKYKDRLLEMKNENNTGVRESKLE